MSNYNTGNPVPSIDPRDLDDNATIFDELLQSSAASVQDRLGVSRKTWHQMEIDATALVSPNVAALAGLTLAANKGFYATGVGALATYDLTSLGRTLGGIANAAAGRSALAAAASGANTDITSITGSASSLTTSRSISTTGDATWTVNFNGTANATAAITLAASGVGAGTYGSVTVNAKGLVTAATTATPIANGGTGATTQAAALTALLGASTIPVANGGTGATTATTAGTALGTATVGTNTDQLARSSLIQAEIANKRAWTSYTPTVTPSSGAFTNASATGKYMVAFGICYIQIVLTVVTKGTGTFPIVTLPVSALTGSASHSIAGREVSTGKAVTGAINGGLNGLYVSAYDASDIANTGTATYLSGSFPVA